MTPEERRFEKKSKIVAMMQGRSELNDEDFTDEDELYKVKYQ